MKRIAPSLLVLLLAACATAPAERAAITSAHVTKAGDEQTIAWTITPTATPVRVEMSQDPAARPGAGMVVSRGDIDGSATVKTSAQRTYFTIVTPTGDFERTAARVLPLTGGRNFRDIGGYHTKDGLVTKWGVVYRSGTLVGLTDGDYGYLTALDIKTVVDFRTTSERKSEPTTWRAGAPKVFSKDYENLGDNNAIAKTLMASGVTPEAVAQTMMSFYRDMPDAFADQYADMFHSLAAGDAALLFHCTAGKDRTGVAAGILLTALGVPRDVVLEDYAMSEKVVDYTSQMSNAPDNPNDPYAFMRRLPPDIVRPLMRSDPRYLEAALTTIDQRYGSVDQYLRTKLGLTDAELSAIRKRLLEKTA